MKEMLRTVGWLDEIIVNANSQNIVNGHMRADIAEEEGESVVPVRYVDLTDEEELIALAFFDNISQMAGTDRDQLASLLDSIETDNLVLDAFFDSLKPGSVESGDQPLPDVENEDLGDDKWLILVTCETEEEQVALLEQFELEGIQCKALSIA